MPEPELTDPAVNPAEDPAVDPAVNPAEDPAVDPAANPAAGDDKERNRAGYEQRQTKKQLEELQKELDGYKRRDEEARKAKLTEQQRLKEEADQLRADNERLRTERLQQKIAAEFNLPASLAVRLIGTDEDALRADAADLAKLLPRPKAGTGTNPASDQSSVPTYTRAQLQKDPVLALKVGDMLRAGKPVTVTD